MRKIFILLFVVSIIVFGCKKSSSGPDSNPPPVDTIPSNPIPPDTTTGTPGIHDTLPTVWYDNDNMLLGDPDNALPDEDDPHNFLLRKTDYSESYNMDKGGPNWVSWHLFGADLGSVSRQDDFEPDNSLPTSWYHVSDASFTGSGFDRGHNCPSGDRTSTVAANLQTYLMTNIIPQAPYNNQNTWNNMENYIRSQVSNGMEAYIIMGSYGAGGTGNFGYTTSIDNGHVTVPSDIWKVVVLLVNGNDDTSRINTSTRVIAVDVPNNNNVDENWKSYRTSVDAIEAATGYDLLTRVPVGVQDVIEDKVDNE